MATGSAGRCGHRSEAQGRHRRWPCRVWPKPRPRSAPCSAPSRSTTPRRGCSRAGVRARPPEQDPYANPIALLSLDIFQHWMPAARRPGRRGADPAAHPRGVHRARRGAARLSGRARPRAQRGLDPRACSPAWPWTSDGAPRAVRDVRSRGSSGSTTASCSRRIRPSAGRWSCRCGSPRAAFGTAAEPERRRAGPGRARWPHRPPAQLDLAEEHAQSLLRDPTRCASVVRRVYEIAFDVARELYPDEWRKLRPRLLTLATWVGYDTDGRADIVWTTTFAKRLMVQLDQLRHYRRLSTACLRAGAAASRAPRRCSSCSRRGWRWRSSRPRTISSCSTTPAARTPSGARGWRATARDMTRAAAGGWPTPPGRRPARARAGQRPRTTSWRRALCVLRAELRTQGLTAAGTHVRINAVQLHNAIRKTIGMDHAPDDPTPPPDLCQRHRAG